VPANQGVWAEQRAELAQQVLAQLHGRRSQTALLGLVQDNAFSSQLFAQDLILDSQVLNHFLLLSVHPAGKGYCEERPGFEGHAANHNGKPLGRKVVAETCKTTGQKTLSVLSTAFWAVSILETLE
jgi:hypothetical protein